MELGKIKSSLHFLSASQYQPSAEDFQSARFTTCVPSASGFAHRMRRLCANRRKTAAWRCRLPIRQGHCLVLPCRKSVGRNSCIGRLPLGCLCCRFGGGVCRYGQTGGRMRSNSAEIRRFAHLSYFVRSRCCCPAKMGRTAMRQCGVP